MPRALRAAAVFLGTALLYGWANRLTAEHLRVSADVSVAFPATGVGVAAAFLFGWPAALGVFAGSFLTRWTPNVPAELGFALINAGEAFLPRLLFDRFSAHFRFRPRDRQLRTPKARTTFFLAGVGANTGLAALLGTLLLHASGGGGSFGALRTFVFWWVGDASAAMMLGWPVLESVAAARLLRRWSRARAKHPALAARARAWERPTGRHAGVLLGIVACWAVFATALGAAGVDVPIGGALAGTPILVAAYLFGFRGGLVVGSAVGWVGIARALGAPALDPDHVAAITIAAFDRVGLGVVTGGLFEANRRLIRRMKARYASLRHDLAYVAGVLTAAVESRDPYTEGHMQRVAHYSVRIARRLGLVEDEVERVRLSALLHDIGKIGVPDHILFKPAPLDGEELRLMRAHTEIGARIASNAAILQGAVGAIRNHQERWDGRTDVPYPGYPDGLKGDEIPFHARIVAVADAYDTMTTHRPYRRALGREKALAILKEESGRQFDPRVVEAFLEDLSTRRYQRVTSVFSITSLRRESAPDERADSA